MCSHWDVSILEFADVIPENLTIIFNWIFWLDMVTNVHVWVQLSVETFVGQELAFTPSEITPEISARTMYLKNFVVR